MLRAAITEDLDTGVGRVVDAVDRLGLADNTFVIFMSDNGGGGGGKRGNLTGGKGSVWEGGIRSPLIVRGPGVETNSWCHERVVGFDFFNTFCEWAEIPTERLPDGVEGGSIANLLANGGSGTVTRPRNELVFHFPHYQSADGPQTALFLDNYKLMKFYEDNRLTLFDISKDISEHVDLAGQFPDVVAKMDKMLVRYLADVGALLPEPNPQYDPDRQPISGKRRRAQQVDPILAALDTNGDGRLSREEIKAGPRSIRKLDKNQDGVISRDEIR